MKTLNSIYKTITEEIEKSFSENIEQFFNYVIRKLEIKNPPIINLSKDRDGFITFAHYGPTSKEVSVYIKGRALPDIMRSIAHELVHHKQFENDPTLNDKQIQDIGGAIEDEANARAGSLIKEYLKEIDNHLYD